VFKMLISVGLSCLSILLCLNWRNPNHFTLIIQGVLFIESTTVKHLLWFRLLLRFLTSIECISNSFTFLIYFQLFRALFSLLLATIALARLLGVSKAFINVFFLLLLIGTPWASSTKTKHSHHFYLLF
jgi:hypothetical protein